MHTAVVGSAVGSQQKRGLMADLRPDLRISVSAFALLRRSLPRFGCLRPALPSLRRAVIRSIELLAVPCQLPWGRPVSCQRALPGDVWKILE